VRWQTLKYLVGVRKAIARKVGKGYYYIMSIPDEVAKDMDLKPGDKLIIYYDDGEKTMTIMKNP
jgi:AbrB family looped-hinge helix DNA binding protein